MSSDMEGKAQSIYDGQEHAYRRAGIRDSLNKIVNDLLALTSSDMGWLSSAEARCVHTARDLLNGVADDIEEEQS
jgi:hypothetical protein